MKIIFEIDDKIIRALLGNIEIKNPEITKEILPDKTEKKQITSSPKKKKTKTKKKKAKKETKSDQAWRFAKNGMSVKEIAKEMNIKEQAVYQNLSYKKTTLGIKEYPFVLQKKKKKQLGNIFHSKPDEQKKIDVNSLFDEQGNLLVSTKTISKKTSEAIK